jgi:dimethylaniline monooxygenase (N-oxide forming)
VIFEDGYELPNVDEVVMATGYWFEFPYLDSGKLIPVKENQVKLYKKMFPLTSADKNSIAVIGLIQVGVRSSLDCITFVFQPHGSIMAFSEMQARVFFAVQAGEIKLPAIDVMQEEVDRVQQKLWNRYVFSPRHTIQVSSCYSLLFDPPRRSLDQTDKPI